MFHPHLNQYTNEYLDLQVSDLDDILVTLPLFHMRTGRPHLYVCSVTVDKSGTGLHRRVAGKLIDEFTSDLAQTKPKVAGDISGPDPTVLPGERVDTRSKYPQPNKTSLKLAMKFGDQITTPEELSRHQRIHIGAVYNAVFNGGYVIHNGQVSPFKCSYLAHFPPFAICDVLESIPYPDAKPKKRVTYHSYL